MSKALEARGLTVDSARYDMRRIALAHGSTTAAYVALGVPSSTWHSAYSGAYGPGPKLLDLIYGPTGGEIRPELLGGGEAADVAPAAPEPEEAATPIIAAPVVAAPVCGPDAFGGLTVAELLLRAQRRAILIENELDEALGEIASLQAMALRLGGEHG